MGIISWSQARIRRRVASGWGIGLLRRWLPQLDRPILQLTSGRWSLTAWATGLPVALVDVSDDLRGGGRSVPLVVVPDSAGLILVASNFGSDRHPRWYRKLKELGVARLTWRGVHTDYGVEELEGAAREQAWSRATQVYEGYRTYAERTGGRDIPLLHLVPRNP
jgi:deazaflavin-dependent oxidoreductase (nitroreductase family)